MNSVLISASSKKGIRPENQDNFMVDETISFISKDENCKTAIPENHLLHIVAVSDGIAAGKLGRYCAMAAVNSISSSLKKVNKNIDKNINEDQLLSILEDIVNQANERVKEVLKQFNERGGCTLAMAAWYNDKFFAINIGDSPIFMLKNGEFTKITEEHTLAAYKKCIGEKTEQKDENILLKYLGKNGNVSKMASICIGNVSSGMTVLLCSDGIPKAYKIKKIRRFIEKYGDRDYWYCKKTNFSELLTKRAAQKRNSDNCTAVMITF